MRPSACPSISNDPDLVQALHTFVKDKLRSQYNIVYKTSKKQNGSTYKFPTTPGRQRISSTGPIQKESSTRSVGNKTSTVFGRPLRDLGPTSFVIESEEDSTVQRYFVTVPHFLCAMLNYLGSTTCLTTDGLFRKAGSSARQKKLREEIEVSDTLDHTSMEGLDVTLMALDCASILKQWLRELPEPLIPARLHEVFMKCYNLPTLEDKTNALVLCTLLLPPLHSASLACLIRFLSKVASNASSNKMDSKSLAIVFTPGLFHATVDEMAKGGTSKSGNETGSFNVKMAIVEILINNGSKVGIVEESIDDALSSLQSLSVDTVSCNFMSQSEDNIDAADTDFAGPSARRRKKKKRRSGSLSRVLTAMKGISKAISSRSATPAGSRCNSSTNIAHSHNEDGNSEKCSSATNLSTMDFLKTPDSFRTPKMPEVQTGACGILAVSNGKRKGPQLESFSTTSKQSKAAVLSATPITMPPNRGRSITLKGKFRRKKIPGVGTDTEKSECMAKNRTDLSTSIKGSRDALNYSSCTTTPLPSKPTFSSLIRQQHHVPSFQVPNTPGTPGSFGVPSAAQDLSGFGSCNELDNSQRFDSKELALPDTMHADFQNHRKSKLPSECTSPGHSNKSSKSSITSSGSTASNRSRLSLKSTSSTRSQRRSNGDGHKKPRSPSERKIGLVRRRSQEISRKSSLRERQREVEKLRNRPGLGHMAAEMDVKSPGPLKRGKPNTFQVKPSPMKVVAGKKTTGSPSYRIKMSFKEGQIQNPKVIPRSRNASQNAIRIQDDSVTNLRQDISSIIEKSFGSANAPSTPSSMSSETTVSSENCNELDDAQSLVGRGINMLSINNQDKKMCDDILNDVTSQFHYVNMDIGPVKKQTSLKIEPLRMNAPAANLIRKQTLRRQSSAFEFCRLPSAIAALEKAKRASHHETLMRRQSSAFEIRKNSNVGKPGESISSWKDRVGEPIYENFDRTKQRITRASLRNKNSSVKDLVKRLENVDSSLKLDAPIPLIENFNNSTDKRMSVSTSALPYLKPNASISDFNRRASVTRLGNGKSYEKLPSNISKDEGCLSEYSDATTESLEALDEFDAEPNGDSEQWMDAKEFFNHTPGPTKNFMMLSQAEESNMTPSGCKRSSIVRIRTEKKGLVSKSVQTFTKPSEQSTFDLNMQLDRQNCGLRQKITQQSMLPPSKPPPIIRYSTTNTPQNSSRRLSARMGIAGRSSAMSARNSITSKIVPTTPPTAMGVAGAAARRQSIGFKITNQPIVKPEANVLDVRLQSLRENPKIDRIKPNTMDQKPQIYVNETQYENCLLPQQCKNSNSSVLRSSSIPRRNVRPIHNTLNDGPKYKDNISTPVSKKTNTSSPISRQTPGSSNRKSKRIEERRHLTIGFAGETVRSPLKERQNLIATVQRSKSAQTPSKLTKLQQNTESGSKNRSHRKQFKDSPYTENSPYSENIFLVQRSKSMRSPQPIVDIPSSLKETIYDVTTPKSDKVKRNLSDRVITPGRGGKRETTPYIKTALFSDGKARTPVQKSTSGNTYHSRLHQIIQQEGTSISSKRSNDLMNSYQLSSRHHHHYSGASPALRKSPRFVKLQ